MPPSLTRDRAFWLQGLLTVVATTVLVVVGASGAGATAARDPTGERADYVVDRAPDRTSALIRGGTMTALVTEHRLDATPPAYATRIEHRYQLHFIGVRSGAQTQLLEDAFFTPEFLERLRVDGAYQGATFRIAHLGFADAHTMDGHDFPHCDVVRIYDIQRNAPAPLVALALRLVTPALASGDDLDNVVIQAHISYGVPVLGAVKLDISGDYRGQPVKAGADYVTPDER